MLLTTIQLPEFNSVPGERLFYNRWEYCVRFTLIGVSHLRKVDHNYIDASIKLREDWQRQLPVYYRTGLYRTEYTAKHIIDLHNFCDLLLQHPDQYKLVVSGNVGYVYTSNLELISVLSHTDYLQYKKYTRSVVNRPIGTIKLKESRYSKRSYFKSKVFNDQQCQQVRTFFTTQQNDIRLSPSLKEWTTHTSNWRNWVSDYFFVDHNDDSILLLISLISPGLIRKTVSIIVDK